MGFEMYTLTIGKTGGFVADLIGTRAKSVVFLFFLTVFDVFRLSNLLGSVPFLPQKR